jgi:hypothetical protein
MVKMAKIRESKFDLMSLKWNSDFKSLRLPIYII